MQLQVLKHANQSNLLAILKIVGCTCTPLATAVNLERLDASIMLEIHSLNYDTGNCSICEQLTAS